MWALYVVAPGLSEPIVIEGYTSKRWAEEMGQEAATRFNGSFWATKRPLDNPQPVLNLPDDESLADG